MILTMCQERGAQPQTFSSISQQLGNKTPAEVSGFSPARASGPGGPKEKAGQGEARVANREISPRGPEAGLDSSGQVVVVRTEEGH